MGCTAASVASAILHCDSSEYICAPKTSISNSTQKLYNDFKNERQKYAIDMCLHLSPFNRLEHILECKIVILHSNICHVAIMTIKDCLGDSYTLTGFIKYDLLRIALYSVYF